MTEHTVSFNTTNKPVRVPTGTLLSEAARLAGVDIGQPCGGARPMWPLCGHRNQG
ncbi:MAG TPA: hypothetical protein VF831_03595 [Anaerolineales bacterium]